MQTGYFSEAIQYFTEAVRLRPKNGNGWEALIHCLYRSSYYDEALEQANAAIKITEGKTIFIYYKAAILFACGKSKEAILYLDEALRKAPKQLKKFVELYPGILQNQLVVDCIARHKKTKGH